VFGERNPKGFLKAPAPAVLKYPRAADLIRAEVELEANARLSDSGGFRQSRHPPPIRDSQIPEEEFNRRAFVCQRIPPFRWQTACSGGQRWTLMDGLFP
jgi:hypothetical protein